MECSRFVFWLWSINWSIIYFWSISIISVINNLLYYNIHSQCKVQLVYMQVCYNNYEGRWAQFHLKLVNSGNKLKFNFFIEKSSQNIMGTLFAINFPELTEIEMDFNPQNLVHQVHECQRCGPPRALDHCPSHSPPIPSILVPPTQAPPTSWPCPGQPPPPWPCERSPRRPGTAWASPASGSCPAHTGWGSLWAGSAP